MNVLVDHFTNIWHISIRYPIMLRTQVERGIAIPANSVKYVIDLSEEEKSAKLEGVVQKTTTERRIADRARIILWADKGIPIGESSQRLGCAKQTVQNWWRKWYLERRNKEEISPVETLKGRPRPGRPRDFSPEAGG